MCLAFADFLPEPWALISLVFLISLGVSTLCLWLGTLGYRKMPNDVHWTERARRLWPLRIARGSVIIWTALALGVLAANHEKFSTQRLAVAAVAAGLGAALGRRIAWHGLNIPSVMNTGNWRSFIVLWTIVAPGVTALLVMLVLTMNRPFNAISAGIVVGVILLTMIWSMGINVWTMRALGFLRPVNEQTRVAVDAVCQKLGTEVKGVYELDLPMANAFALTWSRSLAYTPAAVALLSAEELEGLTAHEIGHLKEPPAMKWKRLFGLVPVGLLGLMPPVSATYGIGASYAVLVGSLLLRRLHLRGIRQAEVDADRCAHEAEVSSGAYARALENLHEASLIPAVMGKGATHPDLYDRMIATGVTPAYPRPAKPERWQGIVTGLASALLALLIAWFLGL